MSKQTKNISIGILCVVILAVVGGFWYWQRTPQYSLSQINKAVKNHDVNLFRKHVDVDGIIDKFYTEITSAALVDSLKKDESASGALGSILGAGLLDAAKNKIVGDVSKAINSYVETGKMQFGGLIGIISQLSDKKDEKNASGSSDGGISGDQLKKLLKDYKITSEGKVAFLDLKIHPNRLEEDLNMRLILKDMGGYWQIAQLDDPKGLYAQFETISNKKAEKLAEESLSLLSKGNFTQAIDVAQEGKSFNGDNIKIAWVLGQAFFNQEKYENAVEHLNKAANNGQFGADAWRLLGLSQKYLNDKIWINSLKKALELMEPNNPNRYQMLMILFNEVPNNLGLEYLKQAHEIKPEEAAPLFIIGTSYYEKDINESLKYFQMAASKNTVGSVSSNQMLAFHFVGKKQYNEVIEPATKAINANIKEESIVEGWNNKIETNKLYDLRAASYYRIGKIGKAGADCIKLKQLQPDFDFPFESLDIGNGNILSVLKDNAGFGEHKLYLNDDIIWIYEGLSLHLISNYLDGENWIAVLSTSDGGVACEITYRILIYHNKNISLSQEVGNCKEHDRIENVSSGLNIIFPSASRQDNKPYVVQVTDGKIIQGGKPVEFDKLQKKSGEEPKFKNLRALVGKDLPLDAIKKDTELDNSLKQLLGSQFNNFLNRLEIGSTLSLSDNRYISGQGIAPHLGGEEEAIYIVDLFTGKVAAALMTESKSILYVGINKSESHPIKDWNNHIPNNNRTYEDKLQ